ncbi:MAG: ATP-binding protein [Gammaproteobacteria bacterium]
MQHSESLQTPANRRLRQRLTNKVEELSAFAEAVEIFGAEAGWDPATVMQVNLALEELIVNTIDYGYPDGRGGTIDVLIETGAGEIRITLEDDGDAFDPFALQPPDLSLAIEDRPVGGLGIHLVRSYMDSYRYDCVNGRNRIVLDKHLAKKR